MSKQTPRTNVGMVRKLMESSKAGPLMQVFVVTAIEKYAALCIEAGAEKFDSAFMSGAAWLECARVAKDWSDSNYGSAGK